MPPVRTRADHGRPDRVRRAFAAAAGAGLLSLAFAWARGPKGEDVHRPGADCRACHTADAAALQADPAGARTRLVPDLEARCAACHAAQGASHRTGMRPRHPLPPGLPLAADGTIGCATCHYLHGEPTRTPDFERIDNRRGALCLTCHTLTELQ